ncbi:MAG TPA: hypothetical protein VG146_17170 [Verrucomicrobiae bacterium]|nr:hypothetical protein [Verrucomicrobiae bacterium]
MLDNLVHYLLLGLAALAQDSPVAHDPNAELRQIHEFLTGVVALRRGELVSRRLTLEQQRLSITQSKSQQELDQLFWAWTKRPDINSKLYPHRDPEKERRKVVHLIDQQLLGISKPVEDLPDPDPLAYI